MKTVQIKQYGDATTMQIVETPKPVIQNKQVLVKIIASGLTPMDVKIRSGMMAGVLPKTFPFTMGWEAAGTIAEVGKDVTTFKTGDEVYTMANAMKGGTDAEYTAIDAVEVALKPKTLTFAQAASVPISSGAAYTAVDVANISKGQKVLIHGAAGTVGLFAVQIAKEKGAYIIATASGKGTDLLKSLGADEVIDYTKTDFTNVVKDVDVVLDFVGGETLAKSYDLVKKGGIVISAVIPPSEEQAAKFGIKVAMLQTPADGNMFKTIATMIDEGKLKVQHPVLFSLDDAVKAHQMIENKTAKGKIVFEVA